MGIWKTLGIKRTSDLREIKRAYARQLRLHSPEDDPAGFMQLREAYEQALGIARFLAQPSTPIDERSSDDIPALMQLVEQPVELSMQVPSAGERLYTLYNDFDRRINVFEWQQLVESWNIGELHMIQGILVSFLNTHYVLPGPVWAYLDKQFEFSRDRRFLWKSLMKPENDWCSAVLSISGLPYSYRESCVQLQIDASVARSGGDWEAAADLSRRALELYGYDSVMLRIQGDALQHFQRYAEAVDMYMRSFALYPNDGVRLSLAQALMGTGRFQEALKHLRCIRTDNNTAHTVSVLIFECEYRLGIVSKRRYQRWLEQQQQPQQTQQKKLTDQDKTLLIVVGVMIGIWLLLMTLMSLHS